jgi:MFS family permease
MRRYADLLSRPGALTSFVAAFVGRLPTSMIPIGLVLLVQQVRGSYALAGQVTGVYAIATAVTAPVWGRALDRWGQLRVMVPLGIVSGGLLAVLALATTGGAPAWWLFALAAGVGALMPPWFPAARAVWRQVSVDARELNTAYALDAVLMEIIFVLGPLFLSAMLGLARADLPLLVTAGCQVFGATAFALTRVSRTWRSAPSEHADGRRGSSPLRVPGVLAAAGVCFLMAVGFGQMDVALAGIARLRLGDPAMIGLLFLGAAGGSAAGGLLFGAWHPRTSQRKLLPITLSVFGTGLGLLALLLTRPGAPPLVVLLPLLFVAGMGIAPGLIIQANLVDHATPADRRSEAQAWVGTAFGTGGAIGSAIAGLLLDAGGPTLGVTGATAALLAAVVAALAGQQVWRAAAAGPSASATASERSAALGAGVTSIEVTAVDEPGPTARTMT